MNRPARLFPIEATHEAERVADVELLTNGAAALGLLLTFLNHSSDRGYREAAMIAVRVAQGHETVQQGRLHLEMLRRDML
jgi:hypothetical protein